MASSPLFLTAYQLATQGSNGLTTAVTIISTAQLWPGCYVFVSSGPMSTYSLKTRSGAK